MKFIDEILDMVELKPVFVKLIVDVAVCWEVVRRQLLFTNWLFAILVLLSPFGCVLHEPITLVK